MSITDYPLTPEHVPTLRYQAVGFLTQQHRAVSLWHQMIVHEEQVWAPPDLEHLPAQQRAQWLAHEQATHLSRAGCITSTRQEPISRPAWAPSSVPGPCPCRGRRVSTAWCSAPMVSAIPRTACASSPATGARCRAPRMGPVLAHLVGRHPRTTGVDPSRTRLRREQRTSSVMLTTNERRRGPESTCTAPACLIRCTGRCSTTDRPESVVCGGFGELGARQPGRSLS